MEQNQNEYPYIELAQEVYTRLCSLEQIYPGNIHTWRHHKHVVGGYLNLTKRDYKYYPKLVKFTDEALDYIRRWLTKF